METHDTLSSDPWTASCVPALPGRLPAPARRTGGPGDAPRRVLFISYAFPPAGGGGVQRAAKFAKYLPRCGWCPTVLTVANPSVPVHDDDLARELDPRLPLVRARTWEPRYRVKKHLAQDGVGGRTTIRGLVRRLAAQLLQPDPQILWNPSAFRAAAGVLQVQPHDAILVTGPPFSSFLLGRQLQRRFGVPLILDFRDEWMLVARHLENYQLSGLAHRWQRAMLQKVLRTADAVVATTRASAAELTRLCRETGSAATASCIYNGFDPDDLSGLECGPQVRSRLRIVYTGTLWNLTSIAPLVRALQGIAQAAPPCAAELELVVAGRRTPQQDAILDGLRGTAIRVERCGYLPHRQSLALAASADVLLLLLGDQPGAERVVPAKLFEYLALGKRILAVGPEGEARDLLRDHGQAASFHPAEIEPLTRWLTTQLDGARDPHSPPRTTCDAASLPARLSRYSRSSLTEELAQLLECCVKQPAGRAP